MKSAALVACLTMLVAVCSSAQDWAKAKLEKSPRHGEWVTIKHGERNLQALIVYPEVKSKAPVVVVIHEIFGLTDWVRGVADQLAANGYIAIAPDLLSGMGPNGGRSDAFAGVDAAREAIGKLAPEQVTADLNAAADYGKKLPASNGKLAVAGFCWGGGQSFRFATNRKDLAAAFVFYGPPPSSGMENITAPVYGFYGGNDARISATIPDAEQKLRAAGKKYELVVYEGAGHGFMRGGEDPNGREADKKAHEEAWQRWLKLLKGM
ncbi:MAG: dienelactone hydrolase family protein [Acidobacteriia bacterium]|nr:dienelactone hydrolase family protein [Terriglobia bacterium]